MPSPSFLNRWHRGRLSIAATLAATLAGTLVLASCGESPTANAPKLVIIGSASQTAVESATRQTELPSWIAWFAPRVAHAQGPTSGSPTALKMSFYTLYLSTNADCTSPVLARDYGSTPTEVNLYTNPTLFSADPPNGTYNCVIFKATDLIKITPDAAAGAAWPGRCATGVEATTDLYRAPDTDFRDLAGATVAARGTRGAPVADVVYFFATTNPAALASRVGAPSVNQTVPLTAPLVVPGRMTLYVDATNGLLGALDGTTPYCAMENGTMGFR